MVEKRCDFYISKKWRETGMTFEKVDHRKSYLCSFVETSDISFIITMAKHRSIGITARNIMGPLMLGLILLVSTAAAYQPSQRQQQHRGAFSTGNRREYLTGLLTATTAVVLTASVQPSNAVLGTGECASGVGVGCGDRSEGNDYIRSLQEKSAVNKDMYEKVCTVND
jgi:hypothetical protein